MNAAKLRAILDCVVLGDPAAVRAYYALAGRPLFDGFPVTQARAELLWYLECCEAFGWKLTVGSAASWIAHCLDDRCGVCGSGVDKKKSWPLIPEAFRPTVGLRLRLCIHHRQLLEQKLRERKKHAYPAF